MTTPQRGEGRTTGRLRLHSGRQDGKDGATSRVHGSREDSRPPGEDRAALTGPSGRTESHCPREEAVQLQGASVGPLGCPTGRAQRVTSGSSCMIPCGYLKTGDQEKDPNNKGQMTKAWGKYQKLRSKEAGVREHEQDQQEGGG